MILMVIGAVGAFACGHLRNPNIECANCRNARIAAEQAERNRQASCDWLRTLDSDSARNTWWDECR